MQDVSDWLDEHMATFKPLYATRLPILGPDRVDELDGIFIPRQVMIRVTNAWLWAGGADPTVPIEVTIDSHPYAQRIEIVWHNSAYWGGDRNETRLRGFDAASILMDPYSTGALAMFAFDPAQRSETASCRVWMCETIDEEELVEQRLGPIDPVHDSLWPQIFQRLDKPRGWLGTNGRLEPLWADHPIPSIASDRSAPASSS
ncbi:MAG: hypothetical protein F4Z25_13325 [Chloroflexi bacterium]|nr:hypothetical protein [Chloroflexota bacterium]